MSAEPFPPLTLAHWTGRRTAGETLRDRLEPLRRRLAAGGDDGVYLHVVEADALSRRIAALQSRSAGLSAEALAAAMPLFGVPFAVKDNIDVAGMPTTAACPAFARLAERDAAAVARLLAAGALCIGKTNLDQFATGLVGARTPFPRPSSAFAADRVSGGSSSGSAVTVARGDVPFALGTDTAGSGRIPAAFNNVVGLKPTPGRVGTSGVVPACRSLDCVSVFALTVHDAAQVLAVIEGDDADDPYSAWAPGPAAFASAALRVGVPRQPVFAGDGAAASAAAFAQAIRRVESLGHRPVPVDMAPLDAVAALLYDGPWVAERLTAVESLLEAEPEAFEPTVRALLQQASTRTAVEAFRGQHALHGARRSLAALWSSIDVLLVPSAPMHPRHAEVDADPIGVNAALGRYTNFVNLLGWCALAVPASIGADGLPFGVTFIAHGGADAALARLGMAWQRETRLPLGATGRPATADAWLEPPAVPWPRSQATVQLAVVGAHLSGLPLNGQLVERGATLHGAAKTASRYRLFALPGTAPPKPGLLRVTSGGAAIDVEVWDVPLEAFGSFVALVPAPLAIGSVELDDGRVVHGFVCEAHATDGALDITAAGGWKRHLAAIASAHPLSIATPEESP